MQGSPQCVEQTVLYDNCLRRDSGQSILAQRPKRDFPTLSLGSHSPPGEASCTRQQGAPLLTPQSPSSHTAGPGPAPLRAERPPLPQGLISWRGGSLMGFLELRQTRGVYSRVTTGMPILNGSLFSEVRTLV